MLNPDADFQIHQTFIFIEADWITPEGHLLSLAQATTGLRGEHSTVIGGAVNFMAAGNIRTTFRQFGNGFLQLSKPATNKQLDALKYWWHDIKYEQGGLVIDTPFKSFDFPPWTRWYEIEKVLRWNECENNPEYEQNEVYMKKGEIVPFKDWGGEIRYKHSTEHYIVGQPVEISSINVPLYHATTNLPAVIQSGYLRAGGGQESGGLGGGRDKVVSFTTNYDDALLIMRELIRMGEVARGDESLPDLIHRYAMEDESIMGLYGGALMGVARGAINWWRTTISYKQSRGDTPNTRIDAMTQYIMTREDKGGPKNPVIFGMADSFKGVVKDKCGIVVADPHNIPSEIHEAYARYGPDDFLSEFRIYADVPLINAKFISARSLGYEANPFKSEAQRRYLWSQHPDIARRWTKRYGSKIVSR